MTYSNNIIDLVSQNIKALSQLNDCIGADWKKITLVKIDFLCPQIALMFQIQLFLLFYVKMDGEHIWHSNLYQNIILSLF